MFGNVHFTLDPPAEACFAARMDHERGGEDGLLNRDCDAIARTDAADLDLNRQGRPLALDLAYLLNRHGYRGIGCQATDLDLQRDT